METSPFEDIQHIGHSAAKLTSLRRSICIAAVILRWRCLLKVSARGAFLDRAHPGHQQHARWKAYTSQNALPRLAPQGVDDFVTARISTGMQNGTAADLSPKAHQVYARPTAIGVGVALPTAVKVCAWGPRQTKCSHHRSHTPEEVARAIPRLLSEGRQGADTSPMDLARHPDMVRPTVDTRLDCKRTAGQIDHQDLSYTA